MPKKDVKIIKYGNPEEGTKKTVEQGNIELLVNVTAQAKALCPVDQGLLRNSIMWKAPGGKKGGFNTDTRETGESNKPLSVDVEVGSGIVGTAVEYAGYVEFGTRRQSAQPYLRPAVAIEVLGPKGANVLKEEAIIEMTKALMKGRKTIDG